MNTLSVPGHRCMISETGVSQISRLLIVFSSSVRFASRKMGRLRCAPTKSGSGSGGSAVSGSSGRRGVSALFGLGLLALGASRPGTPWGEAGPLHLSVMGWSGPGGLVVLAIVSRFHTGQGLRRRRTKAAFLLLLVAALLRVLLKMDLIPLAAGTDASSGWPGCWLSCSGSWTSGRRFAIRERSVRSVSDRTRRHARGHSAAGLQVY